MAHPDSAIVGRIRRLPREVLCLLLEGVPMARKLETLDMLRGRGSKEFVYTRNEGVNRLALVCCAWHKIIVTNPAPSLQRMVTVVGASCLVGASCRQLLAAESNWWTVVACYFTTDARVMQVAEGCPGLTTLLVNGGDTRMDASIKAMAEGCPKLTSLSFQFCYELEALSAGLYAPPPVHIIHSP